MAAGGMVRVYQTQMRREQEEQLLFVGEQYKRAISSYYSIYPAGANRSLPTSLEVLVNDNRFPTPMHHLRRLYPDPMTGKPDWELVMSGGGILGVHSRSTQEPFKKSGFPERLMEFENSESYANWKFVVKQQ